MIVKTTRIISERLLPFLMSKAILLTLLLGFVLSAGAQTPFNPLDLDGDGILNTVDPDIDGDGVLNANDLDNDNDGVADKDEKQIATFAFSGFQSLYPSTLPAAASGASGLVVGNRVMVPNALTLSGINYHAIVEITGSFLNSGAQVVITSAKDLAIQKGDTQSNPYFTYTLSFVSAVGFNPANYQNNNPITGLTIPKVSVTFADIDGSGSSKKQGEVVGFATTDSGLSTSQLPLVGSTIGLGGFDFPTAGAPHGPTAGSYSYYRPLTTTATTGSANIDTKVTTPHPEAWLTVFYDNFTQGNYVYGFTGVDSVNRSEAGPSLRLSNVDFTDVDGDGVENIYDLDSDGDGCSDSNEAYADNTRAAQNQQYGMTNGAVAPVDPSNGTVIATDYFIIDYIPAITAAKVSAPANQLSLNVGDNTAFSVVAQGLISPTTAIVPTPVPTYTWQVQTSAAAPWTTVANGGVYSGADTNTLTITGVTGAMNNYLYQVLVNAPSSAAGGIYVCGTITSAAAKLKLLDIPPVAKDDALTVNEDTTGTVNVVSNDTDADGTVDVTTVDLDPTTTVRETTFTVAGKGTYSVNNLGIVTFVPFLNYNGSSSVTYTVNDNQGTPSNVATLVVTITPVNDAPVAVNDIYSLNEDGTLLLSPLVNDTDVDGDVLKIISIAGTTLTPGTAQTIVVSNGTVNIATTGQISFAPALNFNTTLVPGTLPVTIAYVISDGTLTATANMSITVNSVNDAPVANNDTLAAIKGASTIIQVASNDTDVDGTINVATIDLDPTTVTIDVTFTVAGQGTYTANADGTVTFTPVASFAGVATPVNYTIQDNNGATSNVATIAITVSSDSDGDGVLDATEIADGTNPLNACSSDQAHATLPPSATFLAGDCDGDGLTNAQENVNTIPGHPFDSDGNGIPDYLEINNYNKSNSEDEIEVFNAVSPSSSDDKNSVFTIRNIEKYPNNSVRIFNRWGVQVYEANGYGTNGKFFRGQSDGNSTISASSQLPEDTYFYALKYVNSNGDTKERSGYLYINR